MVQQSVFSGVMTAIITPFHKDFSIDIPAFHKTIESQKNNGINGIVVLGTTGESPTLSESESEQLVSAALEHASPSFHIYVGTGTNHTQNTIEKSKKYAKFKNTHGKSPMGLMVVTPYYNKPTQEHLVKHYTEVCHSVADTPICLYNVPGRSVVNILPNTLTKIAKQNKNVVAIKEAAGNMNAFVEMKNALSREDLSTVKLLSGDDATFATSLVCGGNGIISVTTHIIPQALVNMFKAAQNNNLEELKSIHLKTYCINQGISSVPNPVGVKYMLSRLGVCSNVLRAPLYAAEEKEAQFLDSILQELKNNHISLLG